ncbi:MAG: hypothetical protein R6V57_09525 [Vicinamibacterales bacterium]
MTDSALRPCHALVTSFKGGRTYVHSTDLLAALESEACRRLGAGAWVGHLTIRRQATREVDARFEPGADAFGSFRLRGPSGTLRGWLTESIRPITRRVPYDEDALLARVRFEGDAAVLAGAAGGFTRFEQIVTLWKALAIRQVPGPWTLAQVDLDGPLPPAGPLEVQYPRTVDGRLKLGVLSQAGSVLGTCRAILAEANFARGMHK